MNKYTIIFFILWYIIGAIITFKMEFYFWQNKYPDLAQSQKELDKKAAFTFSIGWPIHLFVNCFGANFKDYKKYGNKLNPCGGCVYIGFQEPATFPER